MGEEGREEGMSMGEWSYLDGGWLPGAMLVLCITACCLSSWRFKRFVMEGPGRAGTSRNGHGRGVAEGPQQGRG